MESWQDMEAFPIKSEPFLDFILDLKIDFLTIHTQISHWIIIETITQQIKIFFHASPN